MGKIRAQSVKKDRFWLSARSVCCFRPLNSLAPAAPLHQYYMYEGRVMKLLILGATSLVGQNLLREASRRGHRVTGTYFRYPQGNLRPLDLTNREATMAFFRELRPDAVVCAAGWAHVDHCEQDPERTWLMNVLTARHAAEACAEAGARMALLSSHYVYDGTRHLYTEDDAPNPLCAYGRAKLEAEEQVRAVLGNPLIIRTAVVYGPERRARNFVYLIIRSCLSNTPLQVAHDQVCSPSYAPNVAAALVELIEQRAEGIYHVAGCDVMSRFDFALLACDVMKLNERMLEPVATEELGFRASRPLLNGLDVSKASAILRIPLLTAVEGLSAFYKQAPVSAIASEMAL
mgnify:CR=1 FL=1